MLEIQAISARKWMEKCANSLISAISFVVFAFLDLLDCILCLFYRWADEFMEGNTSTCYCERGKQGKTEEDERPHGVSETLYGRKNVFRDLGVFEMRRTKEGDKKNSSSTVARWSDCSCESCVSWHGKAEEKLHFFVQEPKQGKNKDGSGHSAENVIFLHGFLSSSSFWIEAVFPNLSDSSKLNYRFFMVDLLGFGRSPKPRDCLYTLDDHVRMIEKTIIESFQLNSFHLVAHSMGCIIALAIAAKHPNSVKSITLTAPSYFPSSKEKASQTALNRLAERRVWPPLLFGSSIMSWYEHLGRSICFLFCRNHRTWEWILQLLTRKRDLNFMIVDLTRHTHHSAWHNMHNVICGGARLMDDYLEILNKSRVLITLIHGDKDHVVPLECSYNAKVKVPRAEVKTIADADHCTVILGREKDFTRDLEKIWSTS